MDCLSHIDLRLSHRRVGGDGGFLHVELTVVVEQKQHSAVRTEAGRSVGQYGVHDLVARRGCGDATADLLKCVERSAAACLAIEQNRAVQAAPTRRQPVPRSARSRRGRMAAGLRIG